MYTLGAFFGALSCIYIGDRLGRVRTIQLGALIDVIGAILQASSFSLGQLIVGRLVTGIGFGALSATAPNWQSECSRAGHRGAAVVLESLFISLGLAISEWLNVGMSRTSGGVSWRFSLALGAFWALIVIFMVQMLPESPRWLIKHGRVDEAREVFAALEDVPLDSEQVQLDVEEIEDSLRITGQGKFKDILHNGELRLFHRTVLAAAGQMFQQMSGMIDLLGLCFRRMLSIWQVSMHWPST